MSNDSPNASRSVKLSEQIRDRLRCSHSKRTASLRCLDALAATCDFLEKTGIMITIAQVGALTVTRSVLEGRLKTQSIRNNPGFAGYVKARAAEQKVVGKTAPPSAIRSGDASVDAHIQALEGELAQVRGELKNLRAVIPSLGEYDLQAALEKRKLVLAGPSSPIPNADLVAALRKLLDPIHVRSVGLELVLTGQIAAPDLANAIFLSKKDVDAVRGFLLAIAASAKS